MCVDPHVVDFLALGAPVESSGAADRLKRLARGAHLRNLGLVHVDLDAGQCGIALLNLTPRTGRTEAGSAARRVREGRERRSDALADPSCPLELLKKPRVLRVGLHLKQEQHPISACPRPTRQRDSTHPDHLVAVHRLARKRVLADQHRQHGPYGRVLGVRVEEGDRRALPSERDGRTRRVRVGRGACESECAYRL